MGAQEVVDQAPSNLAERLVEPLEDLVLVAAHQAEDQVVFPKEGRCYPLPCVFCSETLEITAT